MKFYVGLHVVAHARHFDRCMISVNRLRDRKSDFVVGEWMMDSGAFTEITRHGGYRTGTRTYAEQIVRWARCGKLVAAVAQDFMCEPFVLAKTGLTVDEHQRRTVERYESLRAQVPRDITILPVLQGWHAEDYAKHLAMYGALIEPGMWVGVGSVCKRNAKPAQVETILTVLKQERPDIRLHGFGLKVVALQLPGVVSRLHSSDSMAWSFAARYEGRNANDRQEAHKYVDRVETLIKQQAPFIVGLS